MKIRSHSLDRVIELEPGRFITALKFLSYNEPIFNEHFPEREVYPGSMVLQSIFSALKVAFQYEEAMDVLMEWELKLINFKKMCEPGDLLKIELKRIEDADKISFIVSEYFGRNLLCNGQFVQRKD
ncbi:hypothetical protein [Paenibacillus sp. KS-LC4]|uniref:hypothetical protein n=1 Tax=Paenibacillus sp. KS-LC4 TaxID=2979727 RepID=UPI0030D4E787